MKKYIKSLNWYGYSFMLIISSITALTNKHSANFTNWLVLFLIGAFLSLIVLIGTRDKE